MNYAKKNYRLYLHYKKYTKTKNIPKTNSKKKKKPLKQKTYIPFKLMEIHEKNC
jgi:DNA-directed RNA polymerase